MTSIITDERLKEILDGCEGVTQGPWEMQPIDNDDREAGAAFIIGAERQGLVAAALPWPTERDDGGYARVEANGKYIARLDPATVSAMASELLAAREALRPKPGHWEVYWPAGTSKDGPAEARWVEDAPTPPTVNSGDGTK